MGKEIERKFLVKNTVFLDGAVGHRIVQAYLVNLPSVVVRVRIMDDQAWLTIKGPTVNCVRREDEYEISLDDARRMMDNVKDLKTIEKTRYKIWHEGKCWEVDCFEGENRGMIVAEIELSAVDEPFARPDWLGEEVSEDVRYYNSNLIKYPYLQWKE